MSLILRRIVIASAALVVVFGGEPAARADEKTACVEAHTEGQHQQHEGRFSAARESYVACNREVCPALVRQDCVRLLALLDEAQPSIVLDVYDESGAPTREAALLVDGKRWEDRVPARALPIDPGDHVVVVERKAGERLEQRIVLHEGDREHRVSFRFPRAAAAPDKPPAAPRGSKRVPLVLLGLAGAAAASGVVFGLVALDSGRTLEESCGRDRTCDSGAVSAMRREAIASDVSFAVGAALLVGAVVLFALPSRTKPTRAALWPSGVLAF